MAEELLNTNTPEVVEHKKDKRHMGLTASRTISNTVIYFILVIMTVVWLVPFIFLVLQSFRVESTGMVGYIIPEQWGFNNYVNLFTNTKFPKWFMNTFIIALATAALQTIIVLCMSYTLSRLRFGGRKFLMNFMLVLGMFPGMLTMIILYRVLADLNMIKENSWYYKIRGRGSGTLLKSRSGFKNKEDAETQAKMEASLENIKDYEVEMGCEEEEP